MSYTSQIPAIIARARQRAELLVEKTAMDIERGAKQRTPPRVRTGAMLGGWQAHQAGDLEWEVATTVRYAPYQEYGTRYISAHPMLVPAAEAERVPFEHAAGRLFE